MKNFVQKGGTITLIAPYALTSGQGALVGSLFAVATTDIAINAPGEFVTNGVFDLTALGTDTPAAGAKIYWDNTNRRCTTTASGNSLIGATTDAKASGVAVARVRLNGVTV